MRPAMTCLLVLGFAATAIAAPPAPSGKVKVYKGPEGELIAMLEVNKGTEVLVHFRKLGNELDGTTRLYELEYSEHDGHNAYANKKRGSKTYRAYVLLEQGDGVWEFISPEQPNRHIAIVYSDKESDALTVQDVMSGYHP